MTWTKCNVLKKHFQEFFWQLTCLNCRLTESGATEGLKKVNSRVTKVPLHMAMTEVTEEEKDALLKQNESSHEYD